MSIRTRKFVGTIALLVLVAVWGLLAMALAQSVLTDINGFVAAICYRAWLGCARYAANKLDGAPTVHELYFPSGNILSLLFDAVLMSTRCRIDRYCATPFLFWEGDWRLDHKTEPVDHLAPRDVDHIHLYK